MKSRLLAAEGVLLVLVGIAALIHPDVSFPKKQGEFQVGAQKLTIETRRIVTIPTVLSGIVLVAGAFLVYFGARKP